MQRDAVTAEPLNDLIRDAVAILRCQQQALG